MKRKLFICSGAGLSQESGISTFRDAGGLWEHHKIEDVCTLSTFMKNYELVNQFYDSRRAQLARVSPNTAHIKIAELEDSFDVINFTTNVDDLLERAGATNIIHLHGKLTEIRTQYRTDNERTVDIGHAKSDYENLSIFPVKPSVVFFGEMAPEYNTFYEQLQSASHRDKAIVVGSSEEVFTFVHNILYSCNFDGEVIFVNPDKKLTDKFSTICEVHNCKATEFFDNYNFDKWTVKIV